VKVVVRVERVQPQWPKVDRVIRHCVRVALEHLGGVEKHEVAVRLTDNAEIQELNRRYRGIDKPTNILSFAMMNDADDFHPPGEPLLLGDLVIARETLLEEARDQGKRFEDHLVHLVVHGLLHLKGYDHEKSMDAALHQETMEIAILSRMGIHNPYE